MIITIIVFSLIIIASIVFGVVYYRKTTTSPISEKTKKSVENQMDSNPEKIRKAYRKGELGEFKIDRQFGDLPEGCRYINDILIQNGKGYSQIDHVVISPVGLFVIETKNYAGNIYGRAESRNWTQYLGGAKNSFYNPIKQNGTHIKALRSLLKDFRNLDFYSIISFNGRCELKKLDLRNADQNVWVKYDTEVPDFIKRKSQFLLKNQGETLKSETIEEIYQILLEENIVEPKVREEHVNQIKVSRA